MHKSAFYQLFVPFSSVTSFEPIFGNIDVPLDLYELNSDENWQKLELFSFKVKNFNSKMTKN